MFMNCQYMQITQPRNGCTTITLNLNVPMVGQPTKDTPDTYSLVDTEKAVEVHVVDKSLPMSQRIVDSRLTSVDP